MILNANNLDLVIPEEIQPTEPDPDRVTHWLAVSNTRPCVICGSKRKCTFTADNTLAKCCKQADGAFKTTTDNVGPAYFHMLTGRVASGSAGKSVALSVAPIRELNVDALHLIYDRLLKVNRYLIPRHVENLNKRGLNAAHVEHNGYRSIRRESSQDVAGILHREFGDTIFNVPGFSRWPNGRAKLYYPHIKTDAGSEPVNVVMIIPVRNVAGKIVAIKTRIDDPNWDGPKYLWLSSSKAGGNKSNQAVHVPLGTPPVCETVRVTEGELKADAAFVLDGCPIISIPGVGSHAKALLVLKELGAKQVFIAFDADCRTNPDVAGALRKFYKSLVDAGYEVGIEHWDESHGKGIDDLLVNGRIPQVATGGDAIAFLAAIVESSGADLRPQPSTDLDDKPRILCTLNEVEMNDRVIMALAKDPNVFQRAGSLVRIVRDVVSPGISRTAYAPSIQMMPEASVREVISGNVIFQDLRGEELIDIRVPHHVAKAIYNRAQYGTIQKLESVVTFPVLRSDGTVANCPGYDRSTGLYIHIDSGLVEVPDAPGLIEARQAVALLYELVSDFPFEKPVHRASWLAYLLTPLARFAFDGPSPLFMIDANTRGSGKTLLAEITSQIVTGSDFARLAPCRDDDEMRKRITSIALRGDPLILLDNVAGELGGPSLDSALTSTSWSDRILGQTNQVTLPLFSTWVATGNNIVLVADTTRRVCHIRLASPEERPDERTGFAVPDIIPHVRANRSRLLSAALTILSAYYQAGRPKQSAKPWGSFEGWSSTVRQSLLWTGEPDPADAREELLATSDGTASLLSDLIAGWEHEDPAGDGMTAAEAVKKLDELYCCDTFKNAIRELCGTPAGKSPSAVSLGKNLKRFRQRMIKGKYIDCVKNRRETMVWMVRAAGDAGDNRDL